MYYKKILIESNIGKATAIKYVDKIHQSDKDVVEINVELKNQAGEKVILDDTHTVSFMFIDSKNRLHQHFAGRFEGGNAILLLPQEVISTGGNVKVEIRFTKDGKILGSNAVSFPVEPTSIKDGLIENFEPSLDIMTKMTELYEAYSNGELNGGSQTPNESIKRKAIDNVLLYYGYPIGFNGLYTQEKVSDAFAKYDIIVLGDTYQKPEQEVYTDTVAIINMSKQKNTDIQIFGYIPIGTVSETSDSNLSISEIKNRVDEWKTAGATGLFLDEFGYDYGVTRERQNEIIDYIHSKNMNLIANSWRVDYIFNRQSMYLDWIDFEGNANGLASNINENDYILFENAWYYILDGNQAVSHKPQWETENRMYDAYYYYNTPQANGQTYEQIHGTKTIALDAIKTNLDYNLASEMAQRGKLASIIMNIDGYSVGSENWSANGTHREYNISDFEELAGDKGAVKIERFGTTYHNRYERTINGIKAVIDWTQDEVTPHDYAKGSHRILVGNELQEIKTLFKGDLERHAEIDKIKELKLEVLTEELPLVAENVGRMYIINNSGTVELVVIADDNGVTRKSIPLT